MASSAPRSTSAGSAVPLVFDVGMHRAEDTAYYLHRGHRVVAVEANPALAAEAAVRFAAEIAAGRLTILNVAIGEAAAVLPFWVCDDHTEWSSFNRDVASRLGAAHHRIDVQTVTFESLLEAHGVPFFLKVDIEGHDHHCLRALRAERLPPYLSAETSGPVIAQLPRLRELGYTGFKLISQATMLAIELPPTAEQRRWERAAWLAGSTGAAARLARRVVPWRWIKRGVERPRTLGSWHFPRGSSGPFGEDTPGRWLPLEEFQRVWARCLESQARGDASPFWEPDTAHSFWTDVHARRG